MWVIVAVDANLVVNGGFIFDWNNYVIVGHSSNSMYSLYGTAINPYKISFVWNPHPDVNILQDDPIMYPFETALSWGPGLSPTALTLSRAGVSTSLANPSCTAAAFLIPNFSLY
jgi:hypothetical protein